MTTKRFAPFLGILCLGNGDTGTVHTIENLYHSENVVVLDLDGETSAANAPIVSNIAFTRLYVELDYGGNGKPGWIRSGDADKDGDVDLVAGGGNALFVYENDGNARGWTRFGNLNTTRQPGCNGAVVNDVDGDGFPDAVAAIYNGDIGWWKNPGNTTLEGNTWNYTKIADNSRYFLHDLILADLDGDGGVQEYVANLNEGYSNAKIRVEWFKKSESSWNVYTIESHRTESDHGHAGIDVGDIDGDGHADLAYANGWYEAPDDPTTGSWSWHKETDVYGISNNLLRDIDGDDDLDMVVAAGHHGTGVFWLECPSDPKTGTWIRHDVDAAVRNPEGLQVLDLDGDEDLDVIACDLDFDKWDQEVHRVYVYLNSSNGSSWEEKDVSGGSYPSHMLQVADINGDGLMDILGNGCGYKTLNYLENVSTVVTTP